MNLNELCTKLTSEDYLGKREVTEILDLSGIDLESQKKESVSCLIDRFDRFCEINHSGESAHIKYMLRMYVELKKLLECSRLECLVIDLKMEPYYLLRAYVDPAGKTLLAVTIGFDIRKAPDNVWDEAWGMEVQVYDPDRHD